MTVFSKRYGYAPDEPSEVILEDAPSWFRLAYENEVMKIFVREGSGYGDYPPKPIEMYNLNQVICVQFHLDVNEIYESSYLYDFLRHCKWYEFYDLTDYA